jgi:hypothetical protein
MKEHWLVSQIFLTKKSNGQNSLWRAHEIVRTIGSSGVVWTVGSLHEGSAKLQEHWI